MELLWREGRLTARQILDQLYPDVAKPQHGTVQRLLQRLRAKGVVVRTRDLGVNVFGPRSAARNTRASNWSPSRTGSPRARWSR